MTLFCLEERLGRTTCWFATIELEAALGFAMLEKEPESICGEWAESAGELRDTKVWSSTNGERNPVVVVGPVRLVSIDAGGTDVGKERLLKLRSCGTRLRGLGVD